MPTEIPYGNVQKLVQIGITISPASVGAATTAEQTFAVPGVTLLDQIVDVTKPTQQNGLAVLPGRVPSANNVTLVFINPTASPIVPTASERYVITVMRTAGQPTGYMS
jgi:hypothetical protein